MTLYLNYSLKIMLLIVSQYKTLCSLMLKVYLMIEQVDVDNIIYGSTNENLCKIRFAKLMQVGT